MSTLTPTPTSAGTAVTIIQFQTVTVTPINTHTTELYDGLFIDSYWCATMWTNLFIFCCTILVSVIIGSFNRLVAVPFFASFAGAIGNGLNWVTWVAINRYTPHQRRFTLMFSSAANMWIDGTLPLYSFFLLEKILQGRERIFFVSVFGSIYLALIPVRLYNIAVYDGYFTHPQNVGKTLWILDQISKAKLCTLVSLEMFSAFFLLKVFYKARKRTAAMGLGGGRRGLFTQLARSSEIRVATMVIIGVIRLVCYRSYNTSILLKDFDRFAGTLNNCFPILLLLDLLASKMIKLQAAVASRHIGGSNVTPEHLGTGEKGAISDAVDAVDAITGSAIHSTHKSFSTGNSSGFSGHGAVGTLDSVSNDKDLAIYMGKGWQREMSVATTGPIAEVNEDVASAKGSDMNRDAEKGSIGK